MPDVLAGGRWRSGEELDAFARGWLAAVRDAGLDDTPLVAVVLPTSPEGIALLVALSSLRSPVLLLSPDARAWRTEPAIPVGTPLVLPATLSHLVPEGEKVGLIPHVLSDTPRADARAAPLDPLGGPGFVHLTSGSSGIPKPVFFPTARMLAWVRARIRCLGLDTGAGVVIEASPAYSQGLSHVLTAIVLGGPLGLLAAHDHRQALATLGQPVFRYWRASLHFVDAISRCALKEPPVVPPICAVSSRVPPAVFDAFVERFGVPLRQGYSSTETGTITLDASPRDRVQRDTVGRALDDVELHVGDHPGLAADPDRPGRIWVRSPWQMAGYGFPPRVERTGDVDGWWPTRDLGRLRADGYLVLAGRHDDAIRTRDNHLVDLVRVATSLRDVDGVTDAVVIAVDTPSGPSFGAVVECGAGLTVQRLQSKLSQTLPPWSRPRMFELVSALPRLPNGKPDRQACGRLLGGAVPRG